MIFKPKQAESEWRESDDEFYEITTASYDIIFEIDLKQRVEYISPALIEILGYNAHEVIGKNFSNFVVLSDLPIADDAFQAVLSGTYSEFQIIKAKSKDGKIIPLEIKLIPIFDNLLIIGIHGIARVAAFT